MFNWKDLEKLSTREVLDGLMNGKYPLQDNTTKGYYYLQPQKNKYGIEDENEMERINVASAQSPNPKWEQSNNLLNQDNNGYWDKKWNVWCDKNTGFENNEYNPSKYGADIDKDLVNKMMNDTNFQNAMKNYTIPSEGCYDNKINDKGMETKYGISKRWYPNEDIPNLTRERANALLYRDYWNYNGINKLPANISGAVFDNAVNQGPPTAIKNTHKALGIEPGNIIGEQTLNKISKSSPYEFLDKFKNAAQNINNQNIQSDSSQNEFKNGWFRRINRWRVFP